MIQKQTITAIILMVGILATTVVSVIFFSTTTPHLTNPQPIPLGHIVLDHQFYCGHSSWGVKNYQNQAMENSQFGKSPDCRPQIALQGRYDSAHLTVRLRENMQKDGIAWQGVIQGKDPWNITDNIIHSDSNVTLQAALYHNPNFDDLPAFGKYLNITAEWVWLNSTKPNSSFSAEALSDVEAHYLTNLWFVNGKKAVVIDFLWDNLRVHKNDWNQETVTDHSLLAAKGIQYYRPYCDLVDQLYVYHYNVVLDNEPNPPNKWRQRSIDINAFVDDAFNFKLYRISPFDGTGAQSCPSTDPGLRSEYNISDFETGIELQARSDNQVAGIEGGYSYADLSYYELPIDSSSSN